MCGFKALENFWLCEDGIQCVEYFFFRFPLAKVQNYEMAFRYLPIDVHPPTQQTGWVHALLTTKSTFHHFYTTDLSALNLFSRSLFTSTAHSMVDMSQSAQHETLEPTEETQGIELGEVPTNRTGVSVAFPEGGPQAWKCLLGSFLLMFPSFGFQTAGECSTHFFPMTSS